MYAPYCLTSMSSLLKNNPDLRECCFYILSNDISAAMRDKMELLSITSHIFPTRHKNITVIKPWNH